MAYWVERLKEIEEKQKKQEAPLIVEYIPGILLSEFARRDIAVEIYSEVLGCNLWLCSNDKMAAQIREDALEAVCYTSKELLNILKLNPGTESLKEIHEAKAIFPGSSVVETFRKL